MKQIETITRITICHFWTKRTVNFDAVNFVNKDLADRTNGMEGN